MQRTISAVAAMVVVLTACRGDPQPPRPSDGGVLTRTVFSGTCLKDGVLGFTTDGTPRDGDVISDATVTLADPPALTAYVINDFPPGRDAFNAFFDNVFVQEGEIIILCDGEFTAEDGTVSPAWDYRIVMIK